MVLLASLRHPRPGLSLAGVRLVLRSTTSGAVPCCSGLPLLCMPSSLPRRNSWLHASLASPEATAFPEIQAGRLPHHPFRGLLDVHSHYGLHTRRVTKVTLYTEGSNRLSLCDCSDCYRLERQLPGGVRTHWKTVPLHGAPNNVG